jgi:hypothetical protein
MALTSKLTIKLAATLTSVLDLTTSKDPLDYEKSLSLTNGTGANQSDQMWHDTRTIAASGTDSLDLAGSLSNGLGATVTFARVKTIVVFAAAANTNNVVVGGAGSNTFINWVSDATDKIVIRPGGVFVLHSPDATAYAVAAGSADILQVANSSSGSTVTYDVIILGASS